MKNNFLELLNQKFLKQKSLKQKSLNQKSLNQKSLDLKDLKDSKKKKPVPETAETPDRFSEISERLRKIETRQKETALQLEEIAESLQSDEYKELIDAIIAISDLTEDFYRFASENPNPALFEQAGMMWNQTAKAVKAAEIEIIDDREKPFDFRLHTTEGVGSEENIPNGYVIKTLKCGYARRGKIIRRAAVIVNKSKESLA